MLIVRDVVRRTKRNAGKKLIQVKVIDVNMNPFSVEFSRNGPQRVQSIFKKYVR